MHVIDPEDMGARRRGIELLAERARSCRADGLIFAVLTAVVTPALMLAAFLVALALGFGSHSLDLLSSGSYAVPATLGFLLTVFCLAALSPLPRWGMADRRYLGVALIPWIAMGALARLGGWPGTIANWVWWPFALLGLLTLALLGRAYETREDYYLGWLGGWMNDPFTWRDDIDRAHVRFGFIIALPRLLLGAWADLMGSSWMLREPRGDEYSAALDLMFALRRGERDAVRDALDRAGARSAGRAARLLGHLGMLQKGRGGALLSARALDLLDLAERSPADAP